MKQLILEACVENLQQAIQAERNGAHRIELCADLDKDGLTPSLSLIQAVKNAVSIPIKVMVRPRDGNFVYTEQEINQMKETILKCKELDVFGVVLGLLNQNNTIDTENTTALAKLAKPLNVCFHKAIDLTINIIEETNNLSKIIEIDSILTSGGKLTADEGSNTLNEMILATEGKLKIVAAGKVTHENLIEIRSKIFTNEFHGKLIVGNLEVNN